MKLDSSEARKRHSFGISSGVPARLTGVRPRTLALMAHSHLDLSLLELTVKPFGFAIAVHQSSLSTFSCLRIYIGDLLHARVIIAAHNPHVRLLRPEPCFGLTSTKSTQVAGADTVM
jgi:hypothetical protein